MDQSSSTQEENGLFDRKWEQNRESQFQ